MKDAKVFEAATECYSFCEDAIAPQTILQLFLARLAEKPQGTIALCIAVKQQVLAWLALPYVPVSVSKCDFYCWFSVRKHVPCHQRVHVGGITRRGRTVAMHLPPGQGWFFRKQLQTRREQDESTDRFHPSIKATVFGTKPVTFHPVS